MNYIEELKRIRIQMLQIVLNMDLNTHEFEAISSQVIKLDEIILNLENKEITQTRF